LPVASYTSSPLSSPPRRLDPQLEQLWGLRNGRKQQVVTLSKEDCLDNAVSEIVANTDRREEHKVTFAETARLYAVDPETLRQRVLGRKSKADNAVDRRRLSPGEEDIVIDYCKHLFDIGIPVTTRILRDFIRLSSVNRLKTVIKAQRPRRSLNQCKKELNKSIYYNKT
jgi:hypothetical protein